MLNWQMVKRLTHVQAGIFLALLIVLVSPNFGLKHGVSPMLPSSLLMVLGGWLVWKQRAALFEIMATRRLTVIFILLLVPVLISIPASYEIRYSASVAGALLAYYFAGLALVHVLRGDLERAWLAKWITAVLAFWVLDSLIQYFTGTDLFGVTLTPDGRVLGPFDGNLRQSTFIAMLLPVALWFLLRKGLVPALAFFVIAGFVAMLGGVRMVLVMLVVVAAGFYLRLPRWRFKIPAALLVGAMVLTAIGLTPAMKERTALLLETRDIKFETLDRLSSYRLTIWETASHMLIARPLTGVGAGAFAKAYDDYATRADDVFRGGGVHHAHQVYVAAAAETGVPGLAGLILAIVLGVRWYWTASVTRRTQAWPYAMGLTVYFLPFNTQPPYASGNWLFPVLLLLLSAFLAALDDAPASGSGSDSKHV